MHTAPDTPIVLSLTKPNRAMRSSDLTTKADASAAYFNHGSARVLLISVAVLGVARWSVAPVGRGDLIVPIITIGLVGTVEWTIHKSLLHASESAWTTRVLGTGVSHKQHHLSPTELDWMLLGTVEAGVYVIALGLIQAVWVVPLMWITGSALAGPLVTAWLCAAIGLAHYEWVHLLVHTRYRPKSRYYRRLARNHRLHHYRNEHYWLGVTANSGDRLLRTYPRSITDVPLSHTAHTNLQREPANAPNA